jgi:hypothetical protein
MAELAFYQHKHGNLVDHSIGWATMGKYSHVELKLTDTPFSPGPCISSSFRDGGARHKMIDLASGKWTRYRINPDILTLQRELEIAEWFCTQRGLKYDLLGVFAVPFTFWKHKLFRKQRWFCSEITTHICCRWGIHKFPTTQLSPSRQERIVREHPEVFEPVPSTMGPSCRIEGYASGDPRTAKIVRNVHVIPIT